MSIKLKNKFKGCLFLLSFFSSMGGNAETLHSVYESSLNYDAQYLQAKADYPVALNNLAFAQERLLNSDDACDLYRKVLALEPANKTARTRLKRLERTLQRQTGKASSSSSGGSPESSDGRGF